jgi:hypothetical protein
MNIKVPRARGGSDDVALNQNEIVLESGGLTQHGSQKSRIVQVAHQSTLGVDF